MQELDNNKKIRAWKIVALVSVDIILVVLSMFLSYWCTVSKKEFTTTLVGWGVANIFCSIIIFANFGMYSMMFNSVGILDAFKCLVSAISMGVANIVFAFVTGQETITWGTALIYSLFLFIFTGMTRFAKRALVVFKVFSSKKDNNSKRILIVGAGSAALAFIKELHTSDRMSYYPVCILDDDTSKVGKFISGVKVVGTTKNVEEVCEKYNIQEIFITIPSATKMQIKDIVTRCSGCGCPVKVLPGIYQFANGQLTVSHFRKVEIQDLLGREQVNVNLDEIMGYIENKIVLVTGGGGSIGSELCRQIATHSPKRLIILDIYENNAYEIEQELKRKYPSLNLLTLIASVRDRVKMDDVFKKYRPEIVFHAAAHKHVPLMETSPNEAVKNNVFGTLNVARCADRYNVSTFVQISTDKAVNPTNIMGATKRICEMIIQAIGSHSETKFVAVRFGNVLGSNGSVIPLFKKQIEEGGPVTVTHKDIIRYFMTIPEAVSLVLQAGAYAKGGQIFVLDMGEPVKIYDLAYNLIKLSGLEPDVDIKIVCTGLRPGEKLYEERLMAEEGLQRTPNGLISIAKPINFDEKFLWETLDKLYDEAYKEVPDMKESVAKLVPTYKIDKCVSLDK